MSGASFRSVVVIALVAAAYLVVLPEEGMAATKKSSGGGVRGTWNLKENVKCRLFNPGGLPPQIHELGFTLEMARVGSPGSPGPVLPTHTGIGVIDPDVGGFGTAGFFDVFTDIAPPNFPVDSFFDVFVEFTEPDSPVRGAGSPPSLFNNPFDGVGDPTYVGAEMLIDMLNTPEYLHSMFAEVNPDQPGLSLSGFELFPASPAGSSAYHLRMQLHHDGLTPIDPSQPLFWVTIDAVVPEPAGAAMVVLGISGLWLRRRKRC